MPSPLRIGLAGLGTVGASVLSRLRLQAGALEGTTRRRIVVTGVSARDRRKAEALDLGEVRWHDDPVALAQSPDIDLFVELMGGNGDPARAAVRAALGAGKAVVTANKALLAAHGMELATLAEEMRAPLGFEASVAGGIPVVKTLREGLAGNVIDRVYGILNGTCNYILSRMELEGLSFEACLAEAQALGYAEADPTFDIDGFDTAHKLAILSTLAFGTAIAADAIHVEGIRSISLADIRAADELGFRIKLLGVARRVVDGIEGRVHPTMVPKSSAIAQVMGVTNAVTVDADAVRELTLIGPGAGGEATASAVVADIADIARGVRSAPFGRPVAMLVPTAPLPLQRHEGGYYVRLNVADKPGAVAAIAARMAERGISFESIMQRQPFRRAADGAAAPAVPVVLITYATTEAIIREALDAIMQDGWVVGRPQSIRIERE
ncbi:homoserine dehydrogenase [Lichenihabitans sp. Uapishka_5]|uniref:homoserine dehydrogenase n=1 Tax=Lichenihabitans sp. Uapishka_5 TaxID=3037302 RepID=UPI0029E81E9C|nr:homoserine dehydrogenase [Lichenihabitans sp. Uapishka_5]MDX7953230.1 homoserine dehydrogenase [Lichenihabitans sp. Uapishka_5]